ncbi:MAG: hypothetical protein K8S13_00675 [Desulfobacula sp.]|uniref:hypothetical protein n=1 Tax=Desulfobacula sp. TaxID=2593537 RepID=UPI0025BE2BE4|nr:hypothetical protein [Desulfobacula sp.]MCD4718361.1 hypothetical protein [Desulfobacula sp.]
MITRLKPVILFLVLLSIFVFFSMQLEKQRESLLSASFIEHTLPSKLIGLTSLEFKGLASDFLLFKFMTFIGGKVAQKDVIDEAQWESLVTTLDTITDLDPYFWDAYLFAEVFLAWDARKFEDANRLLLKGTQYIPDNYRVFYYLGFNYFYFLKDNENGRKYLMEAARRPGCSSYVANLAARLSVYTFKHRDGIEFLKVMLGDTKDRATRDQFQMRIKTLEIMEYLEQKISEFHELYRTYPKTLDDLVRSGLISRVPADPYGGEFIIMQNGRVYTTSNMLFKKDNLKK